jgi:hypothetical protein
VPIDCRMLKRGERWRGLRRQHRGGEPRRQLSHPVQQRHPHLLVRRAPPKDTEPGRGDATMSPAARFRRILDDPGADGARPAHQYRTRPTSTWTKFEFG